MFDYALIYEELAGAKKGERGTILKKYEKMLKVNKAKIYREIRKLYGPQKEVTRKSRIQKKLIDEVAKVKIKSTKMGLGERELSTEQCVKYLNEQGNSVDVKTISSINRHLVKYGFRNKAPIVRVEAAYSNQQHQLDFSRSKYFQIAKIDNDGDFILKVAGKILTYKENEHRLRTWLVSITDAFSRISLAQAVAATGESAIVGIDFLNFAYNRPEDAHPLKYIPEILKTDNGSFAKTKAVKTMLNALGIKVELSRPYEKHGIQKQESAFKNIWRNFELPLTLRIGEGNLISLSEYNEELHHFMNEMLQKKHPTREGTRLHNYRCSLTAHQPREIAVDLKEVAFVVIERKVRQDLTISINNDKFECPAFALDKRIRIYRNLSGEYMGELIDEFRKPFILEPTKGYVELGNFEHRHAPTYRQRLEKEIKQEKKEEKIKYIEREPKKIMAKTPFNKNKEHIFGSKYAAKVYIGQQLGRGKTYADYAYIFDDLLDDEEGMKKSNIDAVLYEISKQAGVG
jgi:hypothetical protein